jgi:hypothetical protein
MKPIDQAAPILATGFPPETSSIQETGLSKTLLAQLIAKTLYVANELTELSAARHLKLSFSIVKELLAGLCRDKFCEIKKPKDGSGVVFRYTLTDLRLAQTQDYMDASHYVNPAPVTLAQFEAIVHRQSTLRLSFNRASLEKALTHLVLPPHLRDQFGNAVNSGAPLFLYKKSKNGKTTVAETIGEMLSGEGGGEVLFPTPSRWMIRSSRSTILRYTWRSTSPRKRRSQANAAEDHVICGGSCAGDPRYSPAAS